MTPQQLTALNLDKTAVLDDLIQRCYSGKHNELLGEMQFGFLAFLMGHSLEGEACLCCHALCHIPFQCTFVKDATLATKPFLAFDGVTANRQHTTNRDNILWASERGCVLYAPRHGAFLRSWDEHC